MITSILTNSQSQNTIISFKYFDFLAKNLAFKEKKLHNRTDANYLKPCLLVFSVKVEVFVEALRGDHLPFVDDLFWLVSIRRLLDNQQGPNWHNLTVVPPRKKREPIENISKLGKYYVHCSLYCSIFFRDLIQSASLGFGSYS